MRRYYLSATAELIIRNDNSTVVFSISGMIYKVFARDSNRKNKVVPADPDCSGVPGFPYTQLGDLVSQHSSAGQ